MVLMLVLWMYNRMGKLLLIGVIYGDFVLKKKKLMMGEGNN